MFVYVYILKKHNIIVLVTTCIFILARRECQKYKTVCEFELLTDRQQLYKPSFLEFLYLYGKFEKIYLNGHLFIIVAYL